MRLESISISNFKGLRSVVFEPTSFGCLVGENNAGKSSVLQAIVYGLNRPAQLPISLFYDPALPIDFILGFSGVTDEHLQRLVDEHRSKIVAIVIDDKLTFKIRYRPHEKVEITILRLVPVELRYRKETIDATLAGKRGAAIRNAVAEHYPEFIIDLPELPNITSAKTYLHNRIAELPRAAFEQAEGPLPSGITASITALLPEPIYIPAVKNLSDDLKTTQSTSFGRLLGLLLEDMTPDLVVVNESLAALNLLFNRVIENGQEVDRRHRMLQDLEGLLESLLSQNFPRVRVELKIPPPELKTILNAAQIFIDDGSRDLVDNKGDGIKRSLTFALLQAYVMHVAQRRQIEAQDGIAQRPLIFLFEEPELYLHPKSQRILFNTLAQISDAHQVVVTTHSPLFFAPGVTAAFVRVAKREDNPKPVGILFPVNFSLDQTHAESFRLARFENADAAFFSQRIVL
ncbi:MAG: AAA family ATPase, partial [Sulfobacillus sp.]